MHRDTIFAITAALFLAVGIFGGGVWFGYEKARGEHQVVREGARPGQALPGGAVLAPRVPGGTLPLPEPEMPDDATPERGSGTVIDLPPVDVPVGPDGECPAQVQCPSVKVRVDLVKHEDGTRGVVWSAEPGTLRGTIDVPLEDATVRVEPKWAAGLEYEAPTGDIALAVDREVGPFRVGTSVEVKSDDPEIRLGIKWRF